MKKTLSLILALSMLLSSCAALAESLTLADVTGAMEGTRYENRALGFGLNLPEGWRFLNIDELETKNQFNWTRRNISYSLSDHLQDPVPEFSCMVMYAQQTDDPLARSIFVQVNDISREMDRYADGLAAVFDPVIAEGPKSSDVKNGDMTIHSDSCFKTMQIDGGNCYVFENNMVFNDEMPTYSKMIFLLKGHYYCTVSVSSATEDKTEELLSLLFFLKD
jgi:hypothetical protein